MEDYPLRRPCETGKSAFRASLPFPPIVGYIKSCPFCGRGTTPCCEALRQERTLSRADGSDTVVTGCLRLEAARAVFFRRRRMTYEMRVHDKEPIGAALRRFKKLTSERNAEGTSFAAALREAVRGAPPARLRKERRPARVAPLPNCQSWAGTPEQAGEHHEDCNWRQAKRPGAGKTRRRLPAPGLLGKPTSVRSRQGQASCCAIVERSPEPSSGGRLWKPSYDTRSLVPARGGLTGREASDWKA